MISFAMQQPRPLLFTALALITINAIGCQGGPGSPPQTAPLSSVAPRATPTPYPSVGSVSVGFTPVPPPFIPIPREPISTAPSIAPTPLPLPSIVSETELAPPYPVSPIVTPFAKGFFRTPAWLVRPDGDLMGIWMDDGQRGFDDRATPGLYGARLNAATLQATTPFPITSEVGNDLQVAWNPVSHTYWLVWSVYQGNYKTDVRLAQMTPDGSLQGAIQTVSDNGSSPRLAVDPQSGNAILAWSDFRSGVPGNANGDIYGRIYGPDGSERSGELAIRTTPPFQSMTSVLTATDGTSGIVWSDGSSMGMTLQRLSRDGALLGEPTSLMPGLYNDGRSVVSTTNPVTKERFIAWLVYNPAGYQGGQVIVGQRFTSNLDPIGEPVPLAAGSDVTGLLGGYVDPTNGMTVLYWHKTGYKVDPRFNESYSYGGDLIVQRISKDGRPIGKPTTLVSVDAQGFGPNFPAATLSLLPSGLALASWSSVLAKVQIQTFTIPQ